MQPLGKKKDANISHCTFCNSLPPKIIIKRLSRPFYSTCLAVNCCNFKKELLCAPTTISSCGYCYTLREMSRDLK